MPYATRKKSISLPALGVQLPNTSRAHRSNSKTTADPESTPRPPTKRVKRSHDGDELLSPVSPPRSKKSSPDILVARPKSRPGPAEHTPPPSPGDVTLSPKIDTEGINDDIVIAVIEQLEKTGNRPHLIRELATVLAVSNNSVAHSANPAALLSSRLSLYLKRPWTALSPCPLAKELIPVHPRKVFFFLTTSPRQPLPENSDDIISPSLHEMKRLTPSVSDPSVVEDDVDIDFEDRSRLSPSPEVDLFSPEISADLPMAPPTPGESFSGRSSVNPDGSVEGVRRPRRAPSPPLEADERGFTETATAVRARGMSLHDPSVQVSVEVEQQNLEPVEETAEVRQRRDQELGYELFGQSLRGLTQITPKIASSPMMPPRHDQFGAGLTKLDLSPPATDVEMEESESAWNMMRPESIQVEDLDAMFTDF